MRVSCSVITFFALSPHLTLVGLQSSPNQAVFHLGDRGGVGSRPSGGAPGSDVGCENRLMT